MAGNISNSGEIARINSHLISAFWILRSERWQTSLIYLLNGFLKESGDVIFGPLESFFFFLESLREFFSESFLITNL